MLKQLYADYANLRNEQIHGLTMHYDGRGYPVHRQTGSPASRRCAGLFYGRDLTQCSSRVILVDSWRKASTAISKKWPIHNGLNSGQSEVSMSGFKTQPALFTKLFNAFKAGAKHESN
jgi:hypothetical protein